MNVRHTQRPCLRVRCLRSGRLLRRTPLIASHFISIQRSRLFCIPSGPQIQLRFLLNRITRALLSPINPNHLHSCETCGPSHTSDGVKAPSLNLEATFMRRPATLFFLLIFFATLSNARQRASIIPAPASSAASQRTPTSPAITASASTKIIKVPAKRTYKGHLRATWACPVPDTKFLLARKSTPDVSIQARVVKPAKKASKSVVTPHANTDDSQSLESAQFKGRTVALYSPQLFVGNSSPIANKPPGA
jgi:hypothetical protein